MLGILEFTFQTFWHFAGVGFLLALAGQIVLNIIGEVADARRTTESNMESIHKHLEDADASPSEYERILLELETHITKQYEQTPARDMVLAEVQNQIAEYYCV